MSLEGTQADADALIEQCARLILGSTIDLCNDDLCWAVTVMETSKSTLEVVATHALGVPFATWRGTQVRHETSCWVQAPATTNPVTRLYLKCVASMIALCLVYTHLQGFAMCTCHSYQGLDCGLTKLPEPTGFGSMPTRRLGLGVVPHPDLAKSGPAEPGTGCCMAVCTYAAALTVAHQHVMWPCHTGLH